MGQLTHKTFAGKTYYCTFPTGLKEPVLSLLRSDLRDFRKLLALDGLIAFETTASPTNLCALPYVSNVFHLLVEFEDLTSQSFDVLLHHLLAIPNLRELIVQASTAKGHRNFRVVTSDRNKLVRADPAALRRLNHAIADATRLRSHSAKPDVEYWVLLRSEGYAFFSKRLTRRTATERDLARGELRPELANVLCRLSEPAADDVFLDPFCGSDAIPLQRLTMPHRLIFASDRDIDNVKRLRRRLKETKGAEARKAIVSGDDAMSLPRFEDGFVDKIVTDPPWGLFAGAEGDISFLYSGMLKEMSRVVKPRGLIVVVTAQKEIMETKLIAFADKLSVLAKYDLLVSGQKAAIYKIKRITDGSRSETAIGSRPV